MPPGIISLILEAVALEYLLAETVVSSCLQPSTAKSMKNQTSSSLRVVDTTFMRIMILVNRLASCVFARLKDVDFSGAIRLACSEDLVADICALQLLKLFRINTDCLIPKHPALHPQKTLLILS